MNIFHLIGIGLLLGWGAAIPIGPINLEIMRRNLHFGTASGLCFGLGACLADVTYLLILCLGALTVIDHPLTLKLVGFSGSIILTWFGIKILKTKSQTEQSEQIPKLTKASLWQQSLLGYLMTLLNPITILFWLSISAQIATITHRNFFATAVMGFGVITGIVSWIIGINFFLHHTRHRISAAILRNINIAGGIILLTFAMIGFWRLI